MGDDAATVEQLRAELRQTRERHAAEVASLRADAQRRDAELKTAHEQQAATADILRSIASSRFALSNVLNELAERAYRLCRGSSARVYHLDGDVLRIVAS